MYKALFVSHSGERCGVYQYGKNLVRMLRKGGAVDWRYSECAGLEDLSEAILHDKPDIILFNYQVSTLPWLNHDALKAYGISTVGIFHESNQLLLDRESGALFDYWLCPDPTIVPRNVRIRRVPRFLPEYRAEPKSPPSIFTVGTFGFATKTKGFETLCNIVNREFDEAVIRINIPDHDNPKMLGVTPQEMAEMCKREITKPGIDLQVTHEFFDEARLVEFLSENTCNAFLYSDPNAKGISSCVDFALAADRPIALAKSPMFRHLQDINPSLFVEDCSLSTIAQHGTDRLQDLRRQWSSENASEAWNRAVVSILESGSASKAVPDGRGFNKILDDRSRSAYGKALDDLARLAPETIKRKIARANIQQAFALQTALDFLATVENPKILAAGSYEDTTVEALKKLGYHIDEADPNINGMTLLDYYIGSARHVGTYDLVLSVSVLEHVEDDEQFIQIVAEFLKPGGLAVLTVDFKESWRAGQGKPVVDHRLYTTARITDVLIPAAGTCVLVDLPRWAEGREDFEYEGCGYGFAGLVFRQLDADMVRHAELSPVWAKLLSSPKAEAPTKRKDLMTTIRTLMSK